MTTTTPRVWIACLASYNAGRLIGEWVDATDADEMREATERITVEAIKAATEAGEFPVYFGVPEEFAIHDYDGFGDLSSTLGEYPSWETVARIGALIEQYGDTFTAFVEACEPDIDTVTEDEFLSAYRGDYDSEEDFAREHVSETGWAGVPAGDFELGGYPPRKVNPIEELESYLDWEKIAQELFDHGPYTLHGDHVFEQM